MIRKRNFKDITNEEFENIILPFDDVLEEYFINNIVYKFVAYYFSKGYEMNALWECLLKNQLNTALEILSGTIVNDKFDYNKLNQILKDKYSLKIVDNNTSQTIKI